MMTGMDKLIKLYIWLKDLISGFIKCTAMATNTVRSENCHKKTKFSSFLLISAAIFVVCCCWPTDTYILSMTTSSHISKFQLKNVAKIIFLCKFTFSTLFCKLRDWGCRTGAPDLPFNKCDLYPTRLTFRIVRRIYRFVLN